MSAAAIPNNTSPPTPAQQDMQSDLRDFSDRLSPMIVKELRQGLRSKLFVWAFVAMHLVLAFVVLASLQSDSKEDSSAFFWWAVVIPMVLILPLRGFNALTEEIKMDTMDTLILTKLSAWRITFGKWGSIASQIILLGITVLPYLIMRYFGGGIDVSLELRFLFHFMTLGLLLTAFTVGFSWLKWFLVRGILTLAVGGFALGLLAFVIFDVLIRQRYGYRFFIGEHEMITTIIFYVMGGYLTFYLLDFAAAQISPMAENRSTMRRIVTFVLVLAAALFAIFGGTDGFIGILFAFGITSWAGVDAATELPRHLSIITQPFVKRGLLGRVAGRFLYPGWHSGLNFLLLLVVISMTAFFMFFFGPMSVKYSISLRPREMDFFWLTILMSLGQTFLGLLILRLMFPNSKAPFVVFILIQLVLGLFLGLLAMLGEATDSAAITLLGGFSPITAFSFMEVGRYSESTAENWIIWNGLLAAAYLTWLLILSFREFKITRQLEAQSQADLAENSTIPNV